MALNSIDYYELLGVEDTKADLSEIRKAYRKTALVWHPGEPAANKCSEPSSSASAHDHS
jgi:curved DNA-binding protein CbpA